MAKTLLVRTSAVTLAVLAAATFAACSSNEATYRPNAGNATPVYRGPSSSTTAQPTPGYVPPPAAVPAPQPTPKSPGVACGSGKCG